MKEDNKRDGSHFLPKEGCSIFYYYVADWSVVNQIKVWEWGKSFNRIVSRNGLDALDADHLSFELSNPNPRVKIENNLHENWKWKILSAQKYKNARFEFRVFKLQSWTSKNCDETLWRSQTQFNAVLDKNINFAKNGWTTVRRKMASWVVFHLILEFDAIANCYLTLIVQNK